MTPGMVQIGPYQAEDERIGRGGMAVVYRAVHPQTGQPVALKVLSPDDALDPAMVNRFRQEVETALSLRHPNIVSVVDASVQEPPYFFAMEYLGGGSLEDRLLHGPLPIFEAIGIAQALCGALDYAHARGIIHRDIKPANILFDEHGRAVLIDLGIARAANLTRLTAHGTRFGTPDYMSPEQVKGQELDPRSDLFSLAVVLYQMLTGVSPFSHENSLVTMRQVVEDIPESASSRNPYVPRALEEVLRKALSKDPDARYPSAAAFADALQQAVNSPISFHRQPFRHGRTVLVGALCLVVLAMGVLAMPYLKLPSSGSSSPARQTHMQRIVPNIHNLSEIDAQQALKNAGLTGKVVEHQYHDSIPKGNVISAKPEPEQPADDTNEVTLVISDGPKPVTPSNPPPDKPSQHKPPRNNPPPRKPQHQKPTPHDPSPVKPTTPAQVPSAY